MRRYNARNMEQASAKTMRVTGADSNLSPCGGGLGDSTLPYAVSFGPAIVFDLGERLLDGFRAFPLVFCSAFPDQVGADNEARAKSTTVEKSVGYGVRDHERS